MGQRPKFADGEPYYLGAGDHLDWRTAEERNCHFYRPDHPLAERIVAEAKGRTLRPAEIEFDYGRYGARLSVVEPLVGCAGWLRVAVLRVEAFDVEERLIDGGACDDSRSLDGNTGTDSMGGFGGLTSSFTSANPYVNSLNPSSGRCRGITSSRPTNPAHAIPTRIPMPA